MPTNSTSNQSNSSGPSDNHAFEIDETSITEIRAALIEGRTSCEAIVATYLARIAAYDRTGDKPLNSVISINPSALDDARALDARIVRGENVGALAGAPLIIKDNIAVAGIPNTAGSRSLRHSVPSTDATQVARLRAADAIILAKANLAEFAWTPDYSESSLGGMTRNAYDLDRTPGGSSGGTATAVAANFGVAGLGTDTGASIRGPAALQNLVGLRPTMGASSRNGVLPITLTRDTVGPMARSVTDAALLFEITSGFDPLDASTSEMTARPAFDAARSLQPGLLQDKRIGVLRQLSDRAGTHPEVSERFSAALDVVRSKGARVPDVVIPDFESLTDLAWPLRMRHDVDAYLAGLGPNTSIKTFDEIFSSNQYLPALHSFLSKEAQAPSPIDDPVQIELETKSSRLRDALLEAMDDANLDILAFPTWNQPARRLGALDGDGGNNNPVAAHAGLPAITVPMGAVEAGLPTGLQFVARPFAESTIIGAAFDFEQSTQHRWPATVGHSTSTGSLQNF